MTRHPEPDGPANHDENRRPFLKQQSLLTALVPGPVVDAAAKLDERVADALKKIPLSLKINGVKHKVTVVPRRSTFCASKYTSRAPTGLSPAAPTSLI